MTKRGRRSDSSSNIFKEFIVQTSVSVAATTMILFEKSYFKMTKALLSLLGQWPLQSVRKRRIIRTLLALFMLSIVIPEVIELINVLEDLDTVVECIPPLGLHVLNAIKYTTLSFHSDKLLKLMTHMDHDWSSRVDAGGSDVLHDYAERARILAIGYAYYMYVGGGAYIGAPLSPLFLDVVHPLNETRPREFLFRTEYFVDQDEFFVAIFIHAFLTLCVSMTVIVACDTMYSAYIHYACAIFAELSAELENPLTNKEDNFYIDKHNDQIYRHTVECVKMHKRAIEFCDLLESTYTVYFLSAIGMNIFLISFTGVQTVMKLGDPSLLIRYGIFIFGQVMHAFFACWHGQLLIDHSEKIVVAVYKSNWNESSFRTRKLFALMMGRSAKPCQLTAGKLFVVSLETFTTVMKTAMSYFTPCVEEQNGRYVTHQPLASLIIMRNIFQQRYYKINKILLSLIGQWPYQSQRKRFTILVIFLFLATSQIIPQIIAVVEFRDDWNVVVESLPPFVIDLVCGIKLTSIVVNMNKMLKIFERIEVDWKTLAQQPEIHILREYANNGRQFTIVYTVGVYVTTALFMIQPVVPKLLEITNPANGTQPAKFPFPVDYYGINFDTYYFYLLLHSSICVTAILTVIVAADTMFIIQVQHGCALFTVVGHQFQKMAGGVSEDWESYSRPNEDPAFRHLTVCIRNHNNVIQFSELLESSYTWAFFMTVGLNMVVISITGFQTVNVMNEKPEEAIRYAAFTMAQLVHLFFQSFFSQRLMDHSEEIRGYLCQAEWYRGSLNTQKLLNVIIMRTYVPCQLTAGKFLVMSLENFTAIIKTSMSYFTLLRSMQ